MGKCLYSVVWGRVRLSFWERGMIGLGEEHWISNGQYGIFRGKSVDLKRVASRGCLRFRFSTDPLHFQIFYVPQGCPVPAFGGPGDNTSAPVTPCGPEFSLKILDGGGGEIGQGVALAPSQSFQLFRKIYPVFWVRRWFQKNLANSRRIKA